ncbi:hypothetical protein CKAN_01184100 [Cinnamomum micranthum f. kanehirae]|uniref:Gag1-like clamp domain-containing protein n=1 Tax=Cinnamomum micranthum f. kanehirae TaxID=337451 RepID=A0A3S3QDS3_9MAGN|nr:hypothetical protein CKAN_01184100 [Cinnamomum micranthum f. kanehirae]
MSCRSPKGPKIQGRSAKNPSLSYNFWSIVTFEMDNSAVQSQRSISSNSRPNQTYDSHSGGRSTSNPSYEMDNSAVQAQRSILSSSSLNQTYDPHSGGSSTSNPSYEMDSSAVQAQRSISSNSTTNQTYDPHSGGSSTSNPSNFVNHDTWILGFLLWNQTRQQWIENRKSENRSQKLRETRLSRNATYDNLLGTGSNNPFPRPIPLSVRRFLNTRGRSCRCRHWNAVVS